MHRCAALLGSAVLTACLIASAGARGADRTVFRAEADSICRSWLSELNVPRGVVACTPLSGDDHAELGWCFHLSPVGHVVVPALRGLAPVTAWSAERDLDPSLQPEAWHALCSRIERARLLPSGFVAPGWDDGRAGPTRDGVGPLLTSAWHQRAPYNNLCPLGDGGRTTTGCGPLALAQILRYFAWPPVGTGAHTYTWDGDQGCGGNVGGGVLSAFFTDPYAWADMPDDCDAGCSPSEQNALAEIGYEIGVAAETDYSFCGSWMMNSAPLLILPQYFRYADSLQIRFHRYYDAASWFELLRAEIDAGRPVFYTVEGHILVCDGWRTDGGVDQIHVNWGDGGAPYTGWWSVDQLPGSDPLEEDAVIGIRPLARVFPNGSGQFASIQAAVDALPAYGLLELADGVYRGAGNCDIDLHGKPLTIRSASGNAASCVIDCEGAPGTPRRGFRFHTQETPLAVLDAITIRHGYQDDGGGILCEVGASPTLRGVVIDSCTATGSGGALHADGASLSAVDCRFAGNSALTGGATSASGGAPWFRGCDFEGNRALQGGGSSAFVSATVRVDSCLYRANACGSTGGAVLAQASVGTLTACVFDADSAQAGGAVAITSGNVHLTSCTSYGNAASTGGDVAVSENGHLELTSSILAFGSGGAVECSSGGTAHATCSDLFGNSGGDWAGGVAGQEGQDGNLSENPLFCDADEHDFGLHITSPCTEENSPCGLMGALPPMCGGGAVLVVAADGSGDYPTIQAAVDAGFDGTEIRLLPGTYTGAGNRDIDFHGKAILLQSFYDDPASCLIDCQASSADRHRGFYFHSGEGSGARVRGVTVCHGYAAGYDDVEAFGGGAVFCDASSPVLENCIFRDNRAEDTARTTRGGAVSCRGSNARITDCRLESNRAKCGGALSCRGGGAVVVSGCTIAGNQASESGGAVEVLGSATAPEFYDCAFTGNQASTNAGGAVATDYTMCRFTDCRFSANSAYPSGGAIESITTPMFLLRCTFDSNSAAQRGGAILAQDSLAIVSCTFHDNASPEASALYNYRGPVSIANSIFAFGRNGSAVGCGGGAVPVLGCCDIYGNAGGDWTGCIADQLGVAGNISLDPEFCNAGEDDFHIWDTSPCAPFAPSHPECDLVGAWPVGCSLSDAEEPPAEPARFGFGRARPTPFCDHVTLMLELPSLPAEADVRVEIHDVTGRVVRAIEPAGRAPGIRRIDWDGCDGNGRRLPAGLYFAWARVGEQVARGTLVRIR